MNRIPPLQQILGTDKRNPVFSIFRKATEKELHVYYGAQLLEVVPDDRENTTYKLLVARLYNAKVNATILQKVFKVDPKTMKKWGEALKGGDSARIFRVLLGRQINRKLTSEIQDYVGKRFGRIYRNHPRDYSKQLRKEVKEIFDMTISAETLRPYLKELKEKARMYPIENQETSCDDTASEKSTSVDKPMKRKRKSRKPKSDSQANRKQFPFLSEKQREPSRLCHHLGLLLFSGQLLRLGQYFPNDGWLLKQWFSVILLGAVNIEQTKLLDFRDLQMFLGTTLRTLNEQRQQLSRLSTHELIRRLYEFNAREVNAQAYKDFYYDPHTKHYTGMRKVLKGWCPSIRFADKALHMDFIHSVQGYPLYCEPTDNYDDLRERYPTVTERFCHIIGIENEAITFIVDRGVYSYKLFQRIIEDEKSHIITWEKGYKPLEWTATEQSGCFEMERCRNHSSDIQKYLFEYLDESWSKDPRMRLLRVRAKNPKGRQIELGVLTDDKEREAKEVIQLIFRRWLQENDFKYLEEHFGINEITSYSIIPFEQYKGHVEEKQMKSGAYKALEVNRAEIKKELKDALLREHQKKKNNRKRQEQIAHCSKLLEEVEQELQTTEKEMSRLDFLIEQDYVRLDTHNKQLMDALKIIARNAFYQEFQPFKKLYDNFRDDHVLFRNLTRADGLIGEVDGMMEAILIPTAQYPPKIRCIVEQLLDQYNAKALLMPDNSGKRIRFRLGKKDGFKLAIVSEQNQPNY